MNQPQHGGNRVPDDLGFATHCFSCHVETWNRGIKCKREVGNSAKPSENVATQAACALQLITAVEWAEILRRRTIAFAIATVRFCRTVPRSPENDVLRRQLTNAGTGVGANYRASCRSRSDDEWRARMGVVVEEADESDYWLTIMESTKTGPEKERKRLLAEAVELTKIMAASLNTSRGEHLKAKVTVSRG